MKKRELLARIEKLERQLVWAKARISTLEAQQRINIPYVPSHPGWGPPWPPYSIITYSDNAEGIEGETTVYISTDNQPISIL